MRTLSIIGLVFLVSACSSSTTTLVDAIRRSFAPSAAETSALNPELRYLKATNDKNVALMVLGYVDATPRPGTEVWYSADKETIRLWKGRIAGTAGLRTDWRSVRFDDVPDWRSALAGQVRYRRQRDVMPGYAIGVREEVSILPMAEPPPGAPVNLPATLRWFEERSQPQGLTPALPVARFAVDLSGANEQVVYSEQCLSATVCLALQAWPPTPPHANSEKAPAPSPL